MNEQTNKAVAILLVISIALVVIAMIITPTPNPPTPTVTPTTIPSITPTVMPSPTTTDTPTATPTTGFTHQCLNYYQMCVPVGTPGPVGSIPDPTGACGTGFLCWRYPDVTPTVQVTVQPSVTSTPVVTIVPITPGASSKPVPGGFGQYDWRCGWPLENAKLPDGRIMKLCPNGLSYSTNPPTYKDGNAFRTDGGMDWVKARNVPEYADTIALGSIFWVSWAEIEPQEGVFNWKIIDDYVNYAKQNLLMENAQGQLVPKQTIVRLYDFISERPARAPGASNIDGGFNFDDLTPRWLKQRMIEPIPWGGPTRLSGGQITRDDGSHWVKTSCYYDDFHQSKPQGSSWDYTIWKIPKYDRPEYQTAAWKMLTAVGNHYDGTNVVFIVGINGLDGEWGNISPSSYAGCTQIPSSAQQQYPQLSKGVVSLIPQWWKEAAPNSVSYVSCTSFCNPALILANGLGLFQARIIPDSADYHKTSGDGVLDSAYKGQNAWELAYGWGSPQYIYQEMSVGISTLPDFFSFVGGSWNADKSILRSALSWMGRTITTTNEIYWKGYWTCYGHPDFIDCPDDPNDTGNWEMYQGWPRDLEVGLKADHLLTFVNTWVDLPAVDQKQIWAKMLRKLIEPLVLTVDTRWGKVGQTVTVEYYDNSAGQMFIQSGNETKIINLVADKKFKVVTFPMTVTTGIELSGSGTPFIHTIRVLTK